MELQTYSPNVMLPPRALEFLNVQRERPVKLDSTEMSSDRTGDPLVRANEWAVVQQAMSGNADAQEQLFTRHAGRLHRVAFVLLHNKEDAEDAVQDGLCRAFSGLRSFQGRSSFATWLTRIVVNSALMSRRRKSAHREPELLPEAVADVRPGPEARYATTEITALVERHVCQLSPPLRAAFRVGVIDGLSAAESSRALGISVNTFKSRMFRARRKLAGVLQQSRLRSVGELV